MDDKLKALIVDDEVDVCILLSNILENKNLQTTYANTIGEAKRVIAEDHPSIIFLDNHLPDGYGINFIEEIKTLDPTVKIVMITAHDGTSDKDKANQVGADYFMGKPFTRDHIFRAIESLLSFELK
jgi:DNA-binding NtrC family response regulator